MTKVINNSYNTINQRVKAVMDYENLSMNAFAKRLGVSQPTISKIINKRSEPQYSTLTSIIKTFGISPAWLLIGAGTMFEETMNPTASSPGVAFAGDAIEGYSTAQYITEAELKKEIGVNHLVSRFRVIGDSMEPNLRNGDTVFCTNEAFREEYVHVIVTRNGTYVKRLRRQDRSYYVAMSDNRAYSTFTIPVDEVESVWYVKAKLSYNLSGLGEDINTRLTHIEQLISTITK